MFGWLKQGAANPTKSAGKKPATTVKPAPRPKSAASPKQEVRIFVSTRTPMKARAPVGEAPRRAEARQCADLVRWRHERRGCARHLDRARAEASPHLRRPHERRLHRQLLLLGARVRPSDEPPSARPHARAVGVVVRPCDWKSTDRRGSKLLPRDGRAVSGWRSADDAFVDVTQGIRTVVAAVRREMKAPRGASHRQVRRQTFVAAQEVAPQNAKGASDASQAIHASRSPVTPTGLSFSRS